METQLIKRARSYAEGILKNLPEVYTYHNLVHTSGVAKAVEEIGRASNLSDEELETVLVAAWLHDTGYRKHCNNHEAVAKETAAKLLHEWGAPQNKIEVVMGLIQATAMPQNPRNLMEQVLCDA